MYCGQQGTALVCHHRWPPRHPSIARVRSSTYGQESGIGSGPFNSFYEDSRRIIWIGGNDGLRVSVEARFVKINQGGRFRGTVGVVEDNDGISARKGSGIGLHRRRGARQGVCASGLPSVSRRVFDAADGLAGLPVNSAIDRDARSGTDASGSSPARGEPRSTRRC